MVDRPRKPWLAGLLTFAGFGLGQLYNGEWRKALALHGAALLLIVLFLGLIRSPVFHLAAPITLGLGVLLLGFGLADAILAARKRSDSYALRPYNRVLVYMGIVLVLTVLKDVSTHGIRERFVRSFRLPAESMRPTLLVGDHIFVDTDAAGKRPSRRDVIVFQYPPKPSREYVKRVVAVDGDIVELRDKVVHVNGQRVAEESVIHIDPSVHPGELDPRDNFGPYTVPQGSLFVMGDNRDNSNDSRFWGPVDRSLVVGTLRGIYWSWDGEAGQPRWERIGTRPR